MVGTKIHKGFDCDDHKATVAELTDYYGISNLKGILIELQKSENQLQAHKAFFHVLRKAKQFYNHIFPYR